MSEPVANSGTVRFGAFEADLRSGELRKDGIKVKLEGQPFQVLAVLLGRPGQLVTREELQKELWPGETFVDFEQGINAAVKRLRVALEDSADKPRFIETLPRRGYRFIAPIVESSVNGNHADITPSNGTGPGSVSSETATAGETRSASSLYLRYGLVATLAIFLITAAVRLWQDRRLPKSGAIRSIAVLPFKPIAGESRNEAMGFGMADSLATQLRQSNDLVVRPSSSTRRYAADDRDPAQIGHSLGVDAVLDGSIQVAADRIRITTRLIRTSDGKQLWAGNFDEQLRDVFAVQDSITERVATVLNAKLGKQSRKRYTEDVDSYQLFLLGRYTALKLTPQAHFKAIEYFRKAIANDPHYALAYAGITGTYTTYMLASDASAADTMPEAKAAAIKAVELDDELPEAHVALAKVAMFYDWNWAEAERQFLRAYDLDPRETEGQLFLAHFYSNMGNHEKALELAEKARKLDPLTINRNALEGQFLFYAGRYDDSIDRLKQTIELNPNHWLPRMFIARPYIEKGMYREAIAECERAKALGSSSLEIVALAGWSYAKLGETRRTRAEIDELEKISERRYVPPYFAALIHNALGETDVALSLLEKGFAVKDVRMTFLKVDPKWNNLRNEPRFIALMKQMKFE
jgi:TolB-like protein/DNA-binding winged helix-turn-helix (wHTH) protein